MLSQNEKCTRFIGRNAMENERWEMGAGAVGSLRLECRSDTGKGREGRAGRSTRWEEPHSQCSTKEFPPPMLTSLWEAPERSLNLERSVRWTGSGFQTGAAWEAVSLV
jgi:hypothetical protein